MSKVRAESHGASKIKVRSKPTYYFKVADKPKIQVKMAVSKPCEQNPNTSIELPTLNELKAIYTIGKL